MRRPTKGDNGKPERQYKIVTQYSMNPIEEIGLLKMDFLGLRNLDVIEDAVDDHPPLARGRGRDGVDPARRREDLRDARRAATRSASSSSSPRACARRSSRSDRPSSTTSSRSAPSTGPGRCASSPTTRAASATRRRSPTGSAPAPDHRGDLRLLRLPGAADGDLQADRRVHAVRGGRPAQGGGQEEARPDGDDGEHVHRRAARPRAPRRRWPRTCGR